MKKKKITWVTSDWFVDVDLPIIPALAESYQIHWIIVLYSNGRFKEYEFDKLKNIKDLTIDFIHVNQRARNPRTIIDYWKLFFYIKKDHSEYIYVDMVPNTPYIALQFNLLPANKTIYAAHDGSIKSIMSRITKYLYKFCYGFHSKNIQMFSKNQAEEFNNNYPGKNITVIPLLPKFYGDPSIALSSPNKRFLSFGTMHSEKNIGLLIKAAEELYDEGYKDFMVSICGKTLDDWESSYGNMIHHPEIFNLQLRMIENSEIPNLFAMHSFAVYPYKMMSQSGALKVAYAYKKPVIVSDLPAFREEVADGINGFIFKSENISSLKSILKKCIDMSVDEYSNLQDATTKYIDSNYSLETIKDKYIEMFDNLE